MEDKSSICGGFYFLMSDRKIYPFQKKKKEGKSLQ